MSYKKAMYPAFKKRLHLYQYSLSIKLLIWAMTSLHEALLPALFQTECRCWIMIISPRLFFTCYSVDLVLRMWIYESHILELPVQVWICFFSGLNFHYYLSSVHNCEDRFHIDVFICLSNIWLLYIHSRLFTTSRVHLEPTQRPAPSWLVISVGRALHRYRRGHGFKSRAGLNFFQAFFSLLFK